MDLGISVVVNEKEVAKTSRGWLQALPSDLQNAHANRRGEWLTSRSALELAFAKAGVTLVPTEARFSGFQQIESLPEWRFSISHTDEWALVWLMHKDAAIGIGADIEKESRKVSGAAASRIVNSDDFALKPLNLWSLKEAAFKTLPVHVQDSVTLPDIVIEKDRFKVPKLNLFGQWHQETIEHLIRSYAWRLAE